MTMTFKLDPPALAKGLKVGDHVAFGFVQNPDGSAIKTVQPIAGTQ